jgi:hypothetical protein
MIEEEISGVLYINPKGWLCQMSYMEFSIEGFYDANLYKCYRVYHFCLN